MGLNFLDGQAPDATTLCKFRNLLVENGIGKKIFEDVKKRLERAGLKRLRRHNRWRYNHRGAQLDQEQGGRARPGNAAGEEGRAMVLWSKDSHRHSVDCTSANVHDVTVASKLVREDDEVVCGDSGYRGIAKNAQAAFTQALCPLRTS